MAENLDNPVTPLPAADPATPRPLVRSLPPRPPFFDRRRLRLLPARNPRGFLAGMRIRKKLIVLHTLFSTLLAITLFAGLRPAILDVVERAELEESKVLLETLAPAMLATGLLPDIKQSVITIGRGSASEMQLSPETVGAAIANPGRVVTDELTALGPAALVYRPARGEEKEAFFVLAAQIPQARVAVMRLYLLMIAAIMAVYVLVAVALEVFVLPQSVYAPIRRLLEADHALQVGRRGEETIPDNLIPSDELGEIMRSRNESVRKLRAQEAALATAFAQLEQIATDLKRKNHLLETARRNLQDADRLASLGMMSAGIAHELNTPLTVLKGLVERLNRDPQSVDAAQAALMLRVVGRLERLSESLLDFARAREPRSTLAPLLPLVQEAITLVSIDRTAAGVHFRNDVPENIAAYCDADRIMQVMVNLIRNAVDALIDAGRGGEVAIRAECVDKDGRRWISVSVTDDGTGIDSAVLPNLFEPFASTRLDAHGTGLGLAVAEGIVLEHGGIMLARNRTDSPGAVFEFLLPGQAPTADPATSPASGPVSEPVLRLEPGGAGMFSQAGTEPKSASNASS